MFRLSVWTKLALSLALAAFVWVSASPFNPGVANAAPASVAVAPSLGAAASFAVLAGTTVTNDTVTETIVDAGDTVVTGDLGLDTGSSVTGFPPGVVNGAVHINDGVAIQAKIDLTAAYLNLAGQACDASLPVELGGTSPVPGVYCMGTAGLTAGAGTLTLAGSAASVWIFQIASTLITGPGSSVTLTGGASPCNVWWQVGSSATLDTTTEFKGNVLALTSITANTNANVAGRLLAQNGAVTLDDNNVGGGCAVGTGGTGGGTGDTTAPICVLTAAIKGPPAKIVVTAQDPGSGIGVITILKAINAVVVVPAFTFGTTSPVVVTGTKINQSLSSTVQLRVADAAGNVTLCDPVITLVVREEGKPVTQTFTGLPQAESKVKVTNGNPGVTNLAITVNGKKFQVAGLKDDEVRDLDVSSAMKPGTDNTITLEARGKPGGSALVIISD